jgi:RNA polymerase-binding transcription factor DksA
MREIRLMQEFEDRLAGARLRLARSVATTDAEFEALGARECRESAEDWATGTVGDLLLKLQGEARAELDEIDAAQERLVAGRYGVCEECREPIPLRCLRARPTARRCALCETHSETR